MEEVPPVDIIARQRKEASDLKDKQANERLDAKDIVQRKHNPLTAESTWACFVHPHLPRIFFYIIGDNKDDPLSYWYATLPTGFGGVWRGTMQAGNVPGCLFKNRNHHDGLHPSIQYLCLGHPTWQIFAEMKRRFPDCKVKVPNCLKPPVQVRAPAPAPVYQHQQFAAAPAVVAPVYHQPMARVPPTLFPGFPPNMPVQEQVLSLAQFLSQPDGHRIHLDAFIKSNTIESAEDTAKRQRKEEDFRRETAEHNAKVAALSSALEAGPPVRSSSHQALLANGAGAVPYQHK